jgi:hypothetical protein
MYRSPKLHSAPWGLVPPSIPFVPPPHRSPHPYDPSQALLGIEQFPGDATDHPGAPLLGAGTRRQNACEKLVQHALALGYEHGAMDHATMDNIAALLALVQMSMCESIPSSSERARTDGGLVSSSRRNVR